MNKHPLESYSAYLDGHSLREAEVEHLRAWICADESNATEFIEFAILHAAVTDRLRLGRLLEDLASHRSDGFTPSLLAEAIREIETNSPRVALPLPQPVAEPPSPRYWQMLAPTAAVAAILFLGAWAIWQSAEIELPKPAAPRPQLAVVAPQQPEQPKVAARLSTSFDAKWAGAEAMTLGQELLEGASLSLLSGVVKLDMAGGAAVVVEGPSELSLAGPDSLRLEQGKTAVRIAEGSSSFVVETPTMQVIDLGTEFGVEAGPAGDGQVMVFDGSVALAEPSVDAADEQLPPAAQDPARRIGAGFQVSLATNEPLSDALAQPKVLTNPRHFLRPDEVDVRLRALAGSSADHKLAAHYERQRIEGLLAYQGFDAASGGGEFVIGIGHPGILSQAEMQFVPDPEKNRSCIEVQNGPVFMWLDTSPTGPFGREGLLASSGRVGKSGGELWLKWRTQRMRAAPGEAGSAGLSLMFGDRSDLDEPVFFGRGFGENEFLIAETAWGNAPPPDGERVAAVIDVDLQAAGVQDRIVDDQEHAWVARIEFRDGADRVSLWLDADLAQLDPDQPQAVLDVADVEFDRIRIAVNRGDEVWRFSEFAIGLNPRALEQLTHVAEFSAD